MLALAIDLKKGRKKGSRNKGPVKYLAVIKMPDGTERYVYPRDLEGGRTLQEVIAAKAGTERVLTVEFGKEVKKDQQWLPALNYTEGQPKRPEAVQSQRVLEGKPTTDAPQDVTRTAKMALRGGGAGGASVKVTRDVPASRVVADPEGKVRLPWLRELLTRPTRKHKETKKIIVGGGMQFIRQKPGASHSRPQGIRIIPQKVSPEEIKLKPRVKVDPLTMTAELTLRRINARDKAPSVAREILVDIPSLDLNAVSAYPSDMKRRILAKFGGDAAVLQQKFVREPMTTMLTLGLARESPKTGNNMISDAEFGQLVHEWYWKMRNIVQHVVQHYRGTRAYDAAVKEDAARAKRTGTAREVESAFVSKLARQKAEAEGRQVKRGELTKTKSKIFIDSASAEYMGIASSSLRIAAERYKAAIDKDEPVGEESRFDRVAYRRIQMDVRNAAWHDLQNKHGLTQVSKKDVLSVGDIDDPDLNAMAPEWLHSKEANPVDLREWDQVAAEGRMHFFNALATLPEAYKKIISLYHKLTLDEKHGEIEGELGERSFASIAREHPRWPSLNEHGVQTRDERGKLEWVNLKDKTDAYSGQFLSRMLERAEQALANRFKPRNWKEREEDEESADDDGRIPLSESGKLAMRWLQLQSNLRGKQALAVSDYKHMVAKRKLLTAPMGASNKRAPLLMSKEAVGARFFADLGKKRNELRDRLNAARALASAPGQGTKPLSSADMALLDRLDRLYGVVNPDPHVAVVADYTGYKDEILPTSTRASLGALRRLYTQYHEITKETPAESAKRVRAMKRRLNELATVPELDDDQRRLHSLITSEIALREYTMAEKAKTKKAMTRSDFISVLDDFSYNTGRLCAALTE